MLPRITGMIARRILLNYRVPEASLKELVPPPLTPRVVSGYGLIGVCMIRFHQLRPAVAPKWLGLSSENAAHRISVWFPAEGSQAEETGVYVFRRDTDSPFVRLAGGRLFPGVHASATFQSEETDRALSMEIHDREGLLVRLRGLRGQPFRSKVFADHAAASAYFSADRLGVSPGLDGQRLEAIELQCHRWSTEPVEVEEPFVREFAPILGAEYDHTLLMHEIPHHWVERPRLEASWQAAAASRREG